MTGTQSFGENFQHDFRFCWTTELEVLTKMFLKIAKLSLTQSAECETSDFDRGKKKAMTFSFQFWISPNNKLCFT